MLKLHLFRLVVSWANPQPVEQVEFEQNHTVGSLFDVHDTASLALSCE